MLVLIVAVAIVSSLVIEHVVHLFANNYEIEWAAHTDRDSAISAQEIISAMRKTHRESERQMNTAFKVASDGR
ncbi:hypothetical protein HB780_15740 [Rhizobium lusitanum]|uniref:hypothetical protein n=1 Tax=Rhizobium lusitanum TaxID=293958 RepID=UPI001607F8AF|nr:hypothetical protein [Rhizobium lusitanum]QND47174.1 hypothetical protein HB780_15740 [Rhizobium lusitanum]